MFKKFKPASIPIVLSVIVLIIGIFLAGALIFPLVSTGFTTSYNIDASDVTPFMRLLIILFCIAMFVIFGTGIAVAWAIIWGIYGCIRLLCRFVKKRRANNDAGQNEDLSG